MTAVTSPFARFGFDVRYSDLVEEAQRRVADGRHACYELLYVEDGNAPLGFASHVQQTHPGDVFVIPPDAAHRHGDPARRRTWSLQFRADAVDSDIRRALMRLAQPDPAEPQSIVPEDGRPRWEQRFRFLRNELARAEPEESLVRALVRSIFRETVRLADAPCDKRDRDTLVGDVFRFIDARYRYPIGLDDVARAVGMSAAYLTNLMSRRTGRTVHQWITDRRITAAKYLLVAGDLSIGRIAREAGFGDASQFARSFKKATEQTPRLWRALGRQQLAIRPVDDLVWEPVMLDRSLDRYRQLQSLTEELAAVTGAEEIVGRTIDAVEHIFQPLCATFATHDPQVRRWRWSAGRDTRERRILGMLPDTCGDEGDLRLVASGQTVVSRSLRQAPDACLRRLAGYGIGSLMVAPVRVADDCLGALGVWAREDQAFSEVDRALLASMAGVMALALRCASLGHTGGCSLALPMAKSH